jgi:predicted NodU family carbamoyl transferase
MKILGINISHNPSVTLCENEKILKHYDETRFVKNKLYCPTHSNQEQLSFLSIEQKIHDQDIDHIIFCSYGFMHYSVNLRYNEDSLEYEKDLIVDYRDLASVKKFEDDLLRRFPRVKELKYQNEHHLYHALCGFNFSNFDEAICIVMDGGGATYFPEEMPTYQEIESVYFVDKYNVKGLYKHLSNMRVPNLQHLIPTMKQKESHEIEKDGCKYVFSSKKSSGYLFSELTLYLQLSDDPNSSGANSGKTMGLAAYGNLTGNRKEDLAHKLQVKTEKDTLELIDYASKLSDCKNIILSGGYALNCLNNYKYVKKFPHLNFFVDPCAHDGGTSIGAALWLDRKLKNHA